MDFAWAACSRSLGRTKRGLPSSTLIDIKPLPTKQVGIDRPCARPQHRYASSYDREEEMNPTTPVHRRMSRQSDHNLVEGGDDSHKRCPQTGKQKNTGNRCEHVLHQPLRRSVQEGDRPEIYQGGSETGPNKEQARSGPAIRKG